MIRAGRWCCVAGAAIGALGAMAWLCGVGALTAIIPGQPPMVPNTALSLLLLGVAVALRAPENAGRAAKAASIIAALVVLAVAVATLAEYLLASDLGIDRALARIHRGLYPGRPSLVTALALTLLSSGVIVFDARLGVRVRPGEGLALLGGGAAFSALIAFAFGAGPLYRLTLMPMIGVALPTSIALLLISIGMLLERPAVGLMSVAASPGLGGILLRRLVIPALVLPAVLGIVVTRIATAAGAGEPSFQVAVLSAATSVLSLVLLALVASPLNRVHVALEESHARTRDLVELAPDGIFLLDLEGRYIDVNGAGCGMLGYARDEIIGKTIVDLIPPEDVGRLGQAREALLAGQTHVAECTKFLTALRPSRRKRRSDTSEDDLLRDCVEFEMASSGQEWEPFFNLSSKVITAAAQQRAEALVESKFLAMRAYKVEDSTYGLPSRLTKTATKLL